MCSTSFYNHQHFAIGFNLKSQALGFPVGSVVKNLPANAGDSFNPWSRKIPHAIEQISPCTTTTEPMCRTYRSRCALETMLHNKRSHHNEKPTHCNEEQPLLAATRKKPAQQQRPSMAKNTWLLPPETYPGICIKAWTHTFITNNNFQTIWGNMLEWYLSSRFLLLKVWSLISNINIIWELVRNAKSQTTFQIYWVLVCILIKPPGNLYNMA